MDFRNIRTGQLIGAESTHTAYSQRNADQSVMAIKKFRAIIVASVCLNVLMGFFLWRSFQSGKFQQAPLEYPLLSKRIFQQNPNDYVVNFYPLRTQLRDTVAAWGQTFSFYFEYLPTGSSIGVNEKQDFVGASLLKLPMVMAYYKQREKNGLDFGDKTVTIEQKHLDALFGQLWKRGEGATVSLGEAARLALVDSDNTAFNILSNYVAPEAFTEVYEGLDIDLVSDVVKKQTFISAKSYGSILKALYFSAVLREQHSHMILELLTQTKFDDKLQAPIPKNILVAHKIGASVGEQIYQDCGIVYAPKRNYLLCMFSQSAEGEARKRMQEISRLVYAYISTVNTTAD